MRWLALVLVACGGTQPVHESVEREPDWAVAYQQRAKQGCTCADSLCLDAARGELAKLEAEHGGIDDAPPDVQVAHGAFDACWRKGTHDPARDAEASAGEICGCTTGDCVQKWKLDTMHMFDKYGVPDGDTLVQVTPAAGSAWQRAVACKATVTIAGSAALAMMTGWADAVCACKDLDCAQHAAAARGSASWLDIDYGEVTETQLGAELQRYCGCYGNALGKELTKALPVPASMLSVSMQMDCR
ncbi:MAG TPA: hypothetical protein VGL61_15860 [Kofleriaceae bacterium]|jgi:hypothetical protein